VSVLDDAASMWEILATPDERDDELFDLATLTDLPDPASRWLRRVLPVETPLVATIELAMTGSIKLGPRWFPFRATQVLRAGVGFVWLPVVGGRILRFVGADILGPGDARMEFRLHDRIPLVRATGPEVARSAVGRLAAETVAWLPQAAAPQAGAIWAPVDERRAVVSLPVGDESVDVTVTVDADGRLGALHLERWRNDADPPRFEPFGGDVSAEVRSDHGVAVAGRGTVGWGHGTPAAAGGAFFRYEVSRLGSPRTHRTSR